MFCLSSKKEHFQFKRLTLASLSVTCRAGKDPNRTHSYIRQAISCSLDERNKIFIKDFVSRNCYFKIVILTPKIC